MIKIVTMLMDRSPFRWKLAGRPSLVPGTGVNIGRPRRDVRAPTASSAAHHRFQANATARRPTIMLASLTWVTRCGLLRLMGDGQPRGHGSGAAVEGRCGGVCGDL